MSRCCVLPTSAFMIGVQDGVGRQMRDSPMGDYKTVCLAYNAGYELGCKLLRGGAKKNCERAAAEFDKKLKRELGSEYEASLKRSLELYAKQF